MLRTRQAAMDEPNTKNADGSSQDMYAPLSVLGKRSRSLEATMDTGAPASVNTEKRPRNEALEIALASDLEGVKGHAQ